MKIKFFLFVLMIASAIISCMPVGENNSTPDIALESPTVASEPTATSPVDVSPVTETPTDTSEPTLALRTFREGEPMQTSAPWLMVHAWNGYWFIDQQATEAGFLEIPLDYTAVSTIVPAPTGGLMAIIHSHYSGEQKKIEIYSLNENQTLYTQELLDYQGAPLEFANDQDASDFERDRYAAVGDSQWSSDGQQLAFVGSFLGPSSDVYLFDANAQAVSQLTSGPSQAVDLNWSPDDQYIFHAGVDKMYTGYSGAGYTDWVFYAVKADGSEVITIGPGLQEIGGESVVGWASDSEVLLQSDFWYCGFFNLRGLDIESGSIRTIWQRQYDAIAFDPISKQALVWVSADPVQDADCGLKNEEIGLFLVDVQNGDRVKVTEFGEGTYVELAWSEAGNRFVFPVYDQIEPEPTWLTIDLQQQTNTYSGRPVFSPGGGSYALLGPDDKGLTIYGPGDFEQVLETEGDILYTTWCPDGSCLFYFYRSQSEGAFSLYYWSASSPDTTRLLFEDIYEQYGDPPTWVMP